MATNSVDIVPSNKHCLATFLWSDLHILQYQNYLPRRHPHLRSRFHYLCHSSELSHSYHWSSRRWSRSIRSLLWFHDHHRFYCPIENSTIVYWRSLEYVWTCFRCRTATWWCIHGSCLLAMVFLGIYHLSCLFQKIFD